MTDQVKLALGSILVGLIVLALKAWAAVMTGSVALLSDALESTVNVVAAIAALVAVKVALRPADEAHPYGHTKAEFISAVVEGVLIVVAALLILREAWLGFRSPDIPQMPAFGLVIVTVATALNAAWSRLLIRRGTRLSSPALVADGKHLWADVITSAGVVLGICFAGLTGYWVLDPLLAAIVAVNILWSGGKLIAASLSGLLDEAVPDQTMQTIRDVISTEAGGALEAHDLRTRHAGRATFVDFHLVVPGETTVEDAHEVCDQIEAALKDAVPDINVSIHVEPEHKAEAEGADRGVIEIGEPRKR
ncbi:cation diffusion facilitator family transporter [Roseicyclus sp. F158]|uniref:Cation diffusion facilitator family transporter n=1 Tax=Tropicimonas omnivorans TaxID=3075590 RepID=A0ABU3DFW8_9RHOB|nr:cation diffusion facilitator family transporter [Roseicyclus sp. F158]MDT0682611.1 cation diffusion facilitator family transporter [Roseicyclus sp. F158]